MGVEKVTSQSSQRPPRGDLSSVGKLVCGNQHGSVNSGSSEADDKMRFEEINKRFK